MAVAKSACRTLTRSGIVDRGQKFQLRTVSKAQEVVKLSHQKDEKFKKNISYNEVQEFKSLKRNPGAGNATEVRLTEHIANLQLRKEDFIPLKNIPKNPPSASFCELEGNVDPTQAKDPSESFCDSEVTQKNDSLPEIKGANGQTEQQKLDENPGKRQDGTFLDGGENLHNAPEEHESDGKCGVDDDTNHHIAGKILPKKAHGIVFESGRPKDGVCQRCKLLQQKMFDAVTEEEKLSATKDLFQHFAEAKKENKHYRSCIEKAMKEMENWKGEKLSNVHYTFDFAHHFQLPHSRQMGRTSVAQLRRIQVFGVRLDSVAKQLNFIVDENQTIGPDGTQTNGPNAVISMVDHALTEHSFGEQICTLHADNCPGQNKNQFVIAYLCWRVMTGRHCEIKLCMQIPGHTHCLVDSGFEEIRESYRRSDIDSLGQFITLVNKSASSNEALPYNNSWQWRNWKEFLSTFYCPVTNIRKYHHFRFSSAEPWYVFAKERIDSEEKKMYIRKKGSPQFEATGMPALIHPAGMTRERQHYLYRNVRPYVHPAHQEDLCPTPAEE